MAGAKARPVPVLLLGYNRPDLFERLLVAVRSAAPRDVFVSVDGPQGGADEERCAAVRTLAGGIDWAPSVKHRMLSENLGCGAAISSAISWAMAASDRLIILEDDCLPDPSFFGYCDELLERYADDERVMQIAGNNWGASADRYLGASYAFNSFAPVWGWATWRRAWELYDYEMASWPRFRDSGMLDGLPVSRRFRRIMRLEWDRAHAGRGTWDHQWQYAVMRHAGLSASPARNLVVNVGFRPDATHISEADRVFSALPLERLDFPLRHPPEVARSPQVEALFERVYHQKLGIPIRMYRFVVRNPRVRKLARTLARVIWRRPQ